MHLPGTILTITVGNHPKIIPVKFGQNQFCSFRGADVLSELVDKHKTEAGQSPVTLCSGELKSHNQQWIMLLKCI